MDLVKLKDSIRARDGFRCTRCGMTREAHMKEFRRDLEVHRVLPGLWYGENNCVTMCRPCHNAMPKDIEDLFHAPDDIKEARHHGAIVVWLAHHCEQDREDICNLEDIWYEHGGEWSVDYILANALAVGLRAIKQKGQMPVATNGDFQFDLTAFHGGDPLANPFHDPVC